MKNTDTVPSPERINPERFTLLLEEAGWRLVGGRRGVYNRLAPPGLVDESGLHGALLVPLDKEAPEFSSLMAAAIEQVNRTAPHDSWHRAIGPRLLFDPADEFQFRKESATPAGLIIWRQGEDLIASARATLAAGAKAHLAKMRRFSNRLGQFSSRFLDSVLMGQTGVGSYLITAYAPTDSSIPVGSHQPDARSTEAQTVSGRTITLTVAAALEATAEAIDHYRTTASLSGFEDGVRRGISYELSTALQGLTRDSDGGDISIFWEDAVDLLGSIPTSRYEFSGADTAILEHAATLLDGETEPAVRHTIIGRVHLLTKKQLGGPGVFGLESISGQARKVRVRLRNPAEYRLAVKAHDEDLILAVDGELERDGSLHWLYNAEISAEIARVDEMTARLADLSLPEVTDQLSLDDFLEPRDDFGLSGD